MFSLTQPAAHRAIAICIVVAVGACGKKEAPKNAPQAAATAPAAKPELPPDLGMPMDTFVAARVMDLCARKGGESDEKAEMLAADVVQGKKFTMRLQDVIAMPAPPAPNARHAAKGAASQAQAPAEPLPAAATPGDAATAESPATIKALEIYRKAIPLAAAHTATIQRIETETKDCAYAPEVGLIDKAFVDRYAKAFVEIACLQRTMVDKEGQPDVLGHAQAASRIFAEGGFSAGDFSRIGIVLARFPLIQGQIHTKKAAQCPDPRAAEVQSAPAVSYNGTATGARNGSLQFVAQPSGAAKVGVHGALVWAGLPPKPGQDNENALALQGTIGGATLKLAGDRGEDWVRLEGKATAQGFAGTWTAQHKTDKLKGKWQVNRTNAAPAK